MGHVPPPITWRILASLASLSMVNMVAKVMPMLKHCGVGGEVVGPGGGQGQQGEGREGDLPSSTPSPHCTENPCGLLGPQGDGKAAGVRSEEPAGGWGEGRDSRGTGEEEGEWRQDPRESGQGQRDA